MKQRKNIAIIGAGPSGLMAAEILAKEGIDVTIYDHMPSPGRKLLMAGRGGLNLTHGEPLERFIERYGAASEWLSPAIRAFTPQQLIAWCDSLGEDTFVGSSGRIFPRSMKAAPLLRAWLRRLDQLGVQFAMRHNWLGWKGDDLRFQRHRQTDLYTKPTATLLTLGGASWPRLGSNGYWTSLLQECGIAIAPLRPANCGFALTWSEHFRSRFAGQPLKPVTVTHNGQSRQGEAIITAHGIEGGVIYALSAPIRKSIEADGFAKLYLDLRPAMSAEVLGVKLQQVRANKSLSNILRNAGFSPLVSGLLRECTPPELVSELTLAALAARLKALPVTVTATAGIHRAISTAGGIMYDAVNTDFMLLAKPGVFVAGEMLDWEAPTGGYLLQACFSTAIVAAQGILNYCTDLNDTYQNRT